jgi:hypothetical protein
MDDPGVWEKHLELRLDPDGRFVLSTFPDTVALLNGQSFKKSHLRNGDLVDLGSARFQFWLGETRQARGIANACILWGVLVGVLAAEFALIWWLPR